MASRLVVKAAIDTFICAFTVIVGVLFLALSRQLEVGLQEVEGRGDFR